ncbi:MAG: hypothetical protein H7A25_24285 [Leptospiraceae bacterium]|nr:hypothetical protein [Leptospiraceae bacterium]MCP5503040.1 hypothetical protein [Leptospiraceae bacterium]
MPLSILTEEEEGDGEEFVPVFQTSAIYQINLIKNYLELREVKYLVTGEELMSLIGGAIPLEDAFVTLYIQKKNIALFQNFLDKGMEQA